MTRVMDITEYVAAKGITLEILSETTTGIGDDTQYKTTVRLAYDDRTLETPFEFGTDTLGGHALDDRADLVLDNLVFDVSIYRRSESFEDFADEFGINPDSRSELALYEAMGDAAARLAEFVGGDAELENLIHNVERL